MQKLRMFCFRLNRKKKERETEVSPQR